MDRTAKPVKLTPAMQRVMQVVEHFGHFDPIRDGRKYTNTVVALMDRGLLRESRYSRGIHFPATTPAQVWDEAHDEDARRDGEQAAYLIDNTNWVQCTPDGDLDVHTRQTRNGQTVLITQGGFRFWQVTVPGQTMSMSAGGTWREARKAADRFEAAQVWDEAHEEYREVTRAAREADSAAYQRKLARDLGLKVKGDPEPEGWGQPGGMLANPAPASPWVPAVGDTVLYNYGKNSITLRPFGRIILVDGARLKVEWPGGTAWHEAHELEHHPMPSDGAFTEARRANTPAEERTRISDRAAAALADVAELRIAVAGMGVAWKGDLVASLDRIEAALRERL